MKAFKLITVLSFFMFCWSCNSDSGVEEEIVAETDTCLCKYTEQMDIGMSNSEIFVDSISLFGKWKLVKIIDFIINDCGSISDGNVYACFKYSVFNIAYTFKPGGVLLITGDVDGSADNRIHGAGEHYFYVHEWVFSSPTSCYERGYIKIDGNIDYRLQFYRKGKDGLSIGVDYNLLGSPMCYILFFEKIK